jgi:hypothetical protein
VDSPATPLDSRSEPRVATTARSVARAIRVALSLPDTWVLALCVAELAAWNSRAQTLPRYGGPRLGPVLQGMAWGLLYAALFVGFAAAERASEESARRLARRLGTALVLALVSTELVRIPGERLLGPAGWQWQPYLRLFLPLTFAALWCAALLRREAVAIARGVRSRDRVALVVTLGTLLLVAAVLVTAGDLAFPLARSGSSVYQRMAVQVIEPRAWIGTTVILFLVLALVFAVTSSATFAVLLVAPIYATMLFATLVKIHFMHSAVQPLDLLTLPEFMPLFGSFFGGTAIVASTVGIGVWLVALVFAWRRLRTPIGPGRRVAIGITSFALLFATVAIFLPADRLPGPLASREKELQALTMKIGAPEGPFREMARSNGIVLSFLSELRTAFVSRPRDYSADRVREVASRYVSLSGVPAAAKRTGGVSLVLYLVESLMDPNDLGLRFTAEPMPHFRAIAAEQIHGRAIVPKEFGGSANTEFELLTGMTNSFLPEGSIPYRQYVRGPVAALPRVLRDLGYATTAIQADPRYYYDRERVYPLLGFEHTVWLHDEPVRDRAPRGRWPSDESIVSAVIDASRRSRPFFVFAFPSSTHSPYDYGTFADSSLDVAGAPTRAAAAEVKEYVNAVRIADRAIGRMIEQFRGRRDSIIVAVMGDHLPPLSSEALPLFTRRVARLPEAERARATRAVPLLVWANFRLPPGELTLSANMLPGYLLEHIGAPPGTLFAVTDSVRRTLPVVSAVVQDSARHVWLRDSVPPALQAPIRDYWLLQYDLLLGRRYALRR